MAQRAGAVKVVDRALQETALVDDSRQEELPEHPGADQGREIVRGDVVFRLRCQLQPTGNGLSGGA